MRWRVSALFERPQQQQHTKQGAILWLMQVRAEGDENMVTGQTEAIDAVMKG